ncbi:hypothetical protein [Tenacibaculum sp. 190524A02b]|uniref:hypothetical protein n=1 Tax=Tenacibaculum vairaonense TaxID=3137860 RepID=UPI0032B2E8E6
MKKQISTLGNLLSTNELKSIKGSNESYQYACWCVGHFLGYVLEQSDCECWTDRPKL